MKFLIVFICREFSKAIKNTFYNSFDSKTLENPNN